MADKTIDEVTPDTSIGGAEKIPVSDAGTPKSVTIDGIKGYVVSAIEALTAVEAADIANDSVYVKSGDNMKRMTATMLADTIFAYLYGKDAVATLSDSDVVSLKNGTTEKTTTIGAIKSYVLEAVSGNIDVHSLSPLENALSDGNEIAVAQSSEIEGVTVWSTLKGTLSGLASYIIGKLTSITATTSAIGNDDYLLIQTTNSGENVIRKVKRSDADFGGNGDVIGPSNNTADKIPQWSGDDNKTLKDGLSLVSAVESTSQNSEVASALAVYTAVNAVDSKTVDGPESNSDNYVPQWDGADSKLLKNGLSVQDTIRPQSGTIGDIATDDAIPTELAVAQAIAVKGDVFGPALNTITNGYIPSWSYSSGSTQKTLETGYGVVTSLESTSDATIATSSAVSNAIAGKGDVFGAELATITNGYIPVWAKTGSSTRKILANGKKLATSMSGETSSDDTILTARAIYDHCNNSILGRVHHYTSTGSLDDYLSTLSSAEEGYAVYVTSVEGGSNAYTLCVKTTSNKWARFTASDVR